ncbi:MAG: hypothetical protein ACYC0V_05565 [Armatimonadota bacterium]
MRNKLLGEIMIDMGIASKEMVVDCLNKQTEIHQKNGVTQPIGKLMLKNGYVTMKQLEKALELQSKNKTQH